MTASGFGLRAPDFGVGLEASALAPERLRVLPWSPEPEARSQAEKNPKPAATARARHTRARAATPRRGGPDRRGLQRRLRAGGRDRPGETRPARQGRASRCIAPSIRRCLEGRAVRQGSARDRRTARTKSPRRPRPGQAHGSFRARAPITPTRSSGASASCAGTGKRRPSGSGASTGEPNSCATLPAIVDAARHRDLLAENRPHRQLEPVPGARHAKPGMRASAQSNQRIVRELFRDRHRVGAEVEQPPHAFDDGEER